MNQSKLISWVVPCFNEHQVISETITRVLNVSKSLKNYSWEVIFVDDGSSDNTKDIIKAFAQDNEAIKLISLSRNFGHQNAVQAGLDASRGSAVIIIDADLQDPPELASSMLEYWENGYKVVYGRRIDRASETIFKKITALLYYRILNFLSEIPIPLDTGDFRLIDQELVLTLKAMPEKGRFLRGLISWSGYKQIGIPYRRDKRHGGVSKYSLKKMVLFAISGITSFSRRPLRLATIFGSICGLISFLLALWVIYIRLFTNSWVQGWAGLAIGILFLSAIQLLCLGILGEYIGRIYEESKSRPMYLIDDKVGFDH